MTLIVCLRLRVATIATMLRVVDNAHTEAKNVDGNGREGVTTTTGFTADTMVEAAVTDSRSSTATATRRGHTTIIDTTVNTKHAAIL